MPELLSRDALIAVLPKKCRNTLSPEAVDAINDAIVNIPELENGYRDNLLGYTDVIKDGKYKVQCYIDAVRYITYKLMGNNNTVAYTKCFPDRYDRLIKQNASPKEISAYASTYNKGKLVNLIYAQTLIPTYVYNADLHQEAINIQAELMRSARSEKVRGDAANSLLMHLKPPVNTQINLDLGVSQDNSLEELKEITRQLALQQKSMLDGKQIDAKTIAESKIIKEINPL